MTATVGEGLQVLGGFSVRRLGPPCGVLLPPGTFKPSLTHEEVAPD